MQSGIITLPEYRRKEIVNEIAGFASENFPTLREDTKKHRLLKIRIAIESMRGHSMLSEPGVCDFMKKYYHQLEGEIIKIDADMDNTYYQRAYTSAGYTYNATTTTQYYNMGTTTHAVYV
jgi:hypothetical protein